MSLNILFNMLNKYTMNQTHLPAFFWQTAEDADVLSGVWFQEKALRFLTKKRDKCLAVLRFESNPLSVANINMNVTKSFN